MPRNYATLFVISFVVGCSSAPVTTKFDAEWEFLKNPKGERKACLASDDVKKLREILIRCRQECENDN